jgi:hypothetical protein
VVNFLNGLFFFFFRLLNKESYSFKDRQFLVFQVLFFFLACFCPLFIGYLDEEKIYAVVFMITIFISYLVSKEMLYSLILEKIDSINDQFLSLYLSISSIIKENVSMLEKNLFLILRLKRFWLFSLNFFMYYFVYYYRSVFFSFFFSFYIFKFLRKLIFFYFEDVFYFTMDLLNIYNSQFKDLWFFF